MNTDEQLIRLTLTETQMVAVYGAVMASLDKFAYALKRGSKRLNEDEKLGFKALVAAQCALASMFVECGVFKPEAESAAGISRWPELLKELEDVL